MPVSFAFKNDIQCVSISAGLLPEEDAAVRLKLDQKISAGREKVLFHLTSFPCQDERPRSRLMSLVSYCLERNVAVAIAGVEMANWPYLRLKGKRQPLVFASEEEALRVFQKIPSSSQAAFGQMDSLSSDSTSASSDSASGAEEDIETVIRRREIEALLRQYEPYQATGESDPFSLEKLEVQYRNAPNKDALLALERAVSEVSRKHPVLLRLRSEAERWATDTLQFIEYRKLPLSEVEAEARSQEIEVEQQLLEAERDRLKAEIEKLEHLLSQTQAALTAHRAACEAKLHKAETAVVEAREALQLERDQYEQTASVESTEIERLERELSLRKPKS